MQCKALAVAVTATAVTLLTSDGRHGRPILVHVPKTAGTSLALWLYDTSRPPDGDTFHYRHRAPTDRPCELFDRPWWFAFRFTVIITFRDPLQRLESAFNYFRYRESGIPRTFAEYVNATKNPMLSFLTERIAPTEKDLDDVLRAMGWLRPVITLAERFDLSIANVERALARPVRPPRKRARVRKAVHTEERVDWEATQAAFALRHSQDMSLHGHAVALFDRQTAGMTLPGALPRYDGADDYRDTTFSMSLYLAGNDDRCILDFYRPGCCAHNATLRTWSRRAYRMQPKRVVEAFLTGVGVAFDVSDPLQALQRFSKDTCDTYLTGNI